LIGCGTHGEGSTRLGVSYHDGTGHSHLFQATGIVELDICSQLVDFNLFANTQWVLPGGLGLDVPPRRSTGLHIEPR